MRMIDYLGHVYIINLPERTDRRAETRQELRAIGIDPNDPRVQFFEATRPDEKGDFPTIGARGCFLSQLRLLKHARDQGHERVWILEDDVHFNARWSAVEESLVEQLRAQPEWWFAYLGHGEKSGGDARAAPPVLRRSDSGMQCLHCIGVQRAAFQPLIDFLEACLSRPLGHPEGGPMHVDGAYHHLIAGTSQALTLVCHPGMATQRPSRTDIHELGLLDRLPVAREAMWLLRRSKHLALRLGLLQDR